MAASPGVESFDGQGEVARDKRRPDGEDDGVRTRVLRAFTLVCHDSMLRFGEALQVMHNRERIGEGGRFELAARTTKGNKRRAVFLTPRTVDAVRSLPATKFARRTISYWFRELCRIAGVDALAAPGEKQIRPHDLRASGASTADERGARATAIRDAMGHSRMKATEVYLRSAQAENARSATEIMTEAVRRPPVRSPRGAKHKNVKGK